MVNYRDEAIREGWIGRRSFAELDSNVLRFPELMTFAGQHPGVMDWVEKQADKYDINLVAILGDLKLHSENIPTNPQALSAYLDSLAADYQARGLLKLKTVRTAAEAIADRGQKSGVKRPEQIRREEERLHYPRGEAPATTRAAKAPEDVTAEPVQISDEEVAAFIERRMVPARQIRANFVDLLAEMRKAQEKDLIAAVGSKYQKPGVSEDDVIWTEFIRYIMKEIQNPVTAGIYTKNGIIVEGGAITRLDSGKYETFLRGKIGEALLSLNPTK